MKKLKYFTEEEFMMGDLCVYNKMDEEFLVKLDILRGLVEKPLIINSSYRDIEYNKSIGGSTNSMHLYGRAVDLKCKDAILRALILKYALQLELSCGVYQNWIHVDNRDTQLVYVG